MALLSPTEPPHDAVPPSSHILLLRQPDGGFSLTGCWGVRLGRDTSISLSACVTPLNAFNCWRFRSVTLGRDTSIFIGKCKCHAPPRRSAGRDGSATGKRRCRCPGCRSAACAQPSRAPAETSDAEGCFSALGCRQPACGCRSAGYQLLVDHPHHRPVQWDR